MNVGRISLCGASSVRVRRHLHHVVQGTSASKMAPRQILFLELQHLHSSKQSTNSFTFCEILFSSSFSLFRGTCWNLSHKIGPNMWWKPAHTVTSGQETAPVAWNTPWMSQRWSDSVADTTFTRFPLCCYFSEFVSISHHQGFSGRKRQQASVVAAFRLNWENIFYFQVQNKDFQFNSIPSKCAATDACCGKINT